MCRLVRLGIFDFLRDALTLDLIARGRAGHSIAPEHRFAFKVQQFTGPMMAKSLEDTASYRVHRLLALNEVGAGLKDFLHRLLDHKHSTSFIDAFDAFARRVALIGGVEQPRTGRLEDGHAGFDLADFSGVYSYTQTHCLVSGPSAMFGL